MIKCFAIRAVAERLFTDPVYHCRCKEFIYRPEAGTKRLFQFRRRSEMFIYRPSGMPHVRSVYLLVRLFTDNLLITTDNYRKQHITI